MRKILYTCLFILSLSTLTAIAQQLDTLWTKLYGGSYNELAYAVDNTSDGGFAVAGVSSSWGYFLNWNEFMLVKTDANGIEQWHKVYGGNMPDAAYSVEQTSDGGYVIAGMKGSDFGMTNGDIYIVRTNSTGDTIWTRQIGGGNPDKAQCIHQIADGGYIVAGMYTPDAASQGYVCKLNSSGEIVWEKMYGSDQNDIIYDIEATSDGGYIATGKYLGDEIGTTGDIWLLKLNASGDTVWTKSYTDVMLASSGKAVVQTADGGYAITGETPSQNMDAILLKTNSSGEEQWRKIYGGGWNDRAMDLRKTSDGGYIITGGTLSFGIDHFEDVWVIKTDAAGDTIWTSTYGNQTGTDFGNSICATPDGGFAVAAVYQPSVSAYNKAWLIRLEGDGTIVENRSGGIPAEYSFYPPSPNPFNNSTTISFTLPSAGEISLKVFDISGREIQDLGFGIWESGAHSVVWNAKDNASGVFFVRLEAGGYVKTQKVVLMK